MAELGQSERKTTCAGLKIPANDLQDFEEFLLVDLELAESTVQIHVREITKFLRYIKRHRFDVTKRIIRKYFLPYRKNPSAKRKVLSSLKRYFRDYLELASLVDSFKFPSNPFRPKRIAPKEDLQEFFTHLLAS